MAETDMKKNYGIDTAFKPQQWVVRKTLKEGETEDDLINMFENELKKNDIKGSEPPKPKGPNFIVRYWTQFTNKFCKCCIPEKKSYQISRNKLLNHFLLL